MFALLLFSRFQLYTSIELAQKNACRFVLKHCEHNLKEYAQDFRDFYAREDYQSAINLWNNEVVPFNFNGSSLYAIQISDAVVDADFI